MRHMRATIGLEKKYLHMVFINLENAYDKLAREVLWWTMTKKDIPKIYITIEQDMCREVKIQVRTCGGTVEDSPFTIGLHQGLTLSPFLFSALNEITRSIHKACLGACC